MIKNMVMKEINIHEAKVHLSRYLDEAAAGEVIVICRRNVPLAELRPVPARRREPRPIGLDPDGVHVPSSFFDPLPAEVLDGFEGRAG